MPPLDADAVAEAAKNRLSVRDPGNLALSARDFVQIHFSAKAEADGIGAIYPALWGASALS